MSTAAAIASVAAMTIDPASSETHKGTISQRRAGELMPSWRNAAHAMKTKTVTQRRRGAGGGSRSAVRTGGDDARDASGRLSSDVAPKPASQK